MKKVAFCLSVVILLTGCVTDDDLVHVQSQVTRLQGQVRQLERQLEHSNEELASTKGELAVVKEQRVIRLPTGAPTEKRARNTTNTNEVSDEEKRFNNAVQKYKSGDVSGSIQAFNDFLNTYPNSQYKNQVLFNLGQASYTVRNYNSARQALEPLVFQPVNGQISDPAARLLKMVYQAQGNSDDEKRLAEYLQSLATQQTSTAPEPVTTGDLAPSPQTNGVIVESNTAPSQAN